MAKAREPRSRKTSPAVERVQVVDLLRTFSILSVLAAHLVYVPPPSPSQCWWWIPLHKNGAYGVPIFFVVSGFLITRLIAGGSGGLFNPSFREFYVRRLARIFPLFLAVILLGLGATFLLTPAMPRFRYCFLATPGQFNGLFWLSLLSFTFNWYSAFGTAQLMGEAWGVMWSLSVEEQFYLFYPLTLRRLGRAKPFLVFLLAVIASGPLWRWGVASLAPAYAENARFASFGSFDQIAFGALLYFIVERYKTFLDRHTWFCAAACLAGVALLVAVYFSLGPDSTVFVYSFVALGSFLFLLGGLHLRFFESRFLAPLAWPGKYSYGIYLLHIFVFYFFYPLLIIRVDVQTAFIIFALVSTAVAALCYRFFEAPANRFVRRAFGYKVKGS